MTESTVQPDITELIGYNPLDPGFRADPYPHYARLRERAPVFRTGLGFWLVTGYAPGLEILQNDRFGYPAPGELPPGGALPGGFDSQRDFFIFMNPPEHTRMRGHVRSTLSPAVVHELRPYVTSAAERLLDEAFAASDECDLISAYAHQLPFGTICELLGVPDADRMEVMGWAQRYINGISPSFVVSAETEQDRDDALAKLNGYFGLLADERRHQPAADLLTKLVGIRDSDGMSERELIGTCVLLFVAGHTTTTNLIGNSTLNLLRHPDQLTAFRNDPRLEASAIEELVRYDTPTHMSFRFAFDDVSLPDGSVIAKGDQVLVNRGAANRDPAMFADPDRLDLARQDNRHIGFGAGMHVCVGSTLARLQGRVALATLLGRYPDLELAAGELAYHESLVVRGVKALPVRAAAAA
jgi:cytochrome P450